MIEWFLNKVYINSELDYFTPKFLVCQTRFHQILNSRFRTFRPPAYWTTQICSKSCWDWHQMGQIWDFWRLFFSIISVLFFCKPFNNCLYNPIGFCEPENRIIQLKNSLYVQKDTNSEPLVLDADTLRTVPLKHYKIEFNNSVCWLRLLNLAINSGFFF